MELTTVWFTLIAVLWIGYFTLEGFDFGVGMLLPVLAEDATERRVMIKAADSSSAADATSTWRMISFGSGMSSDGRRQMIGAIAQSARLISGLRKNLLALNSGSDAVSSSFSRLRPASACWRLPTNACARPTAST